MLGAASLARDAANGLGMAVERAEKPVQFQTAPNAEFGRLIKYEEAAAAHAKAPNFKQLVRPLTMRGTSLSLFINELKTHNNSSDL